MNGLEAAIKNALARSDRTSAEVRARIYQSSREALEAGLRKQNIEDPEVVAGHRQRLEQLIRLIELQERERLLSLVAEHVKKTAPPASTEDSGPTIGGVLRREPAFGQDDDRVVGDSYIAPESVAGTARNMAAPEPMVEPASAPRTQTPRVNTKPIAAQKSEAPQRAEPRLGVDDDENDFSADGRDGAYDLTNGGNDDANLAFKPEPVVIRKKRRGFFARLMIIFTLLAFIVLGAAWIYTSGVLITAEQRDQSVPNPPVEIEEEDFNGNEATTSQAPPTGSAQQLSGGFSADWIEVFSAEKNFGTMRPGSMVSTEKVELPSGKALRVASRSATETGELSFEIPVELMRRLIGRDATIAVTLQSSTDTPTQVAIDCNLKGLGTCSRHRYTATPERSDMLINANFGDALVSNAAGKITLNADITGEGRSVNLYSVRILPSN